MEVAVGAADGTDTSGTLFEGGATGDVAEVDDAEAETAAGALAGPLALALGLANPSEGRRKSTIATTVIDPTATASIGRPTLRHAAEPKIQRYHRCARWNVDSPGANGIGTVRFAGAKGITTVILGGPLGTVSLTIFARRGST